MIAAGYNSPRETEYRENLHRENFTGSKLLKQSWDTNLKKNQLKIENIQLK